MLLWFAGLTFVAVAWVFASPLLDYRLVTLGAVLPVIEMLLGGPWALHTLLAPVAAMVLVMLVFQGKRRVQRRWLGIPIGMFMYLVLDGAWVRTTLFWWPLFGAQADAGDIPSWEHPALLVVMELVGAAAIWWGLSRYGLTDRDRLDRFWRTGHLTRDAIGPDHGTC